MLLGYRSFLWFNYKRVIRFMRSLRRLEKGVLGLGSSVLVSKRSIIRLKRLGLRFRQRACIIAFDRYVLRFSDDVLKRRGIDVGLDFSHWGLDICKQCRGLITRGKTRGICDLCLGRARLSFLDRCLSGRFLLRQCGFSNMLCLHLIGIRMCLIL